MKIKMETPFSLQAISMSFLEEEISLSMRPLDLEIPRAGTLTSWPPLKAIL